MSKTIFTACLGTETNSVSPIPTGLELFRRTMFVRGGTYGERPGPFALPLIVWRDRSTRFCSNSTADGGGRLSGRRSRAGAPRARTGLTFSFLSSHRCGNRFFGEAPALAASLRPIHLTPDRRTAPCEERSRRASADLHRRRRGFLHPSLFSRSSEPGGGGTQRLTNPVG
jgi:hypothetical protein